MLPVVLIGGVATIILLINLNSKKLMDAIVGVSIVWANLAYLLVTLPLLRRRLRGWPAKGESATTGVFSLRRWGLPINLLAVLWGIALIANVAWPRPEEEDAWYEEYAAVLFTALLLGSGSLYYWLVQRHKTGVLPEHRALPTDDQS